MNLDNNCIKDILLEIEKLPLGQELPFNKLCDTLSKYTEKELIDLYKRVVDKKEYPDFKCWIADMLKLSIFVTV